jgi:hypothetical protein
MTVALDMGTNTPLVLYRQMFETPWINHTRTYYDIEAKKMADKLSYSEFIHYVQRRIDEESERCQKFLDPSSHDKVLEPMINECIVNYSTRIYENFQQTLLEENEKGKMR